MNEPERTPHHLDEEEARPRHANRSPWRATDLIAHHTRPGAAATKKDDPKKDAPERRARRPRARGLVSGARNAARPPGLRRVITNRLTRGDGKVSRLVGTVRRLRARWRTVRRVATVLATLGPPVLLPLALVLLLLLMLLAAGAADQRTATQPSETSDAEVAKYLPEGWHDVLTRAADTTRNGPAFAAVPWTLLGGVVQAQTDYGRYSPYDDIDRDPGRATPVVGPATGTNAPATSGTVTVGNVVGAGPEPVGGVSGPGRAASLSPDHPAPPRGNLSEQLGWFLHALRLRESSDRYDAGHPEGSDACGAYQYLSSTWAGYQGYATACDAPPSVQDRRKIEDTLARWNQGYTWQEIIIDHIYPAWAKSPSLWHQCPAYNCAINPPLWSYVDDIIGYMHDAAEAHPPGGTAPAVRTSPAAHRVPAVPAGGRADCQVANPDPAIGGEGDQGTGPYLLTPAAASEMRAQGADPGNPCHSSEYVAKRLAAAASDVHTDPSSPRWVPNGGDTDKENARKYWSKVIETSGIFVNRSATPGEPCAPPPDAPDRPYSISFKILYIWRCETSRMTDLYVVTMTGATPHTVESDRHAAAELLVQEALSVSYGASRWKTAGCDEGSGKPQGIFPMTKEEAAKAGVRRRCDVAENIAGAARLVLSVERVKPEQRATELGRFQPMVGGWQNLGIALGDDLEHFSRSGPGQTFTASDDCVRAMTRFLTAVAPLASDFAALRSPPSTADLDMWGERLLRLRNDNGIADPANAPACVTGSWAPGFNAILAQLTADLAGRETEQAANLNGLGNYYQALERALEADEPVPGRDSLVAPRLATRPLKRVAAPSRRTRRRCGASFPQARKDPCRSAGSPSSTHGSSAASSHRSTAPESRSAPSRTARRRPQPAHREPPSRPSDRTAAPRTPRPTPSARAPTRSGYTGCASTRSRGRPHHRRPSP
ncbi:hypothetical protein LUW76_33815 [Actinomadura madurae]|uniref:hypothetical protein n=1 Tax=Actinomadura madurae TaxID=1993 RepID=UPI00202756BF|nr:hypothetical protein [Actinomadura madurae]URM98912.1 hypothetical protein LUW76_33815 [Actinomadura madurae]